MGELKHISNGEWVVDWGYAPKLLHIPTSEKSWYLFFATEDDAKEFVSWYFVNHVFWALDEHPRIYKAPLKMRPGI